MVRRALLCVSKRFDSLRSWDFRVNGLARVLGPVTEAAMVIDLAAAAKVPNNTL